MRFGYDALSVPHAAMRERSVRSYGWQRIGGSSLAACAAPSEAPRHVVNVLVIDGDERTWRTFDVASRSNGFTVVAASSGSDGMRIAREVRFDLVVVELKLGDMSGLDVIRAFPKGRPPFILIGGVLAVGTAVQAMKLGAVDVMEKPVDVDRLVAAVSAATGAGDTPPSGRPQEVDRAVDLMPRGSAAERWVRYVLRACEADSDPKTLGSWAQHAAVSYTTICANCRIMQIRPLDARDFTRVLRALMRATVCRCPPEVFLDVSDARTVRTLSLRAGMDLEAAPNEASIQDFVSRQRFVPTDNQGLQLLRERLVR